jgi:hypothetical protein
MAEHVDRGGNLGFATPPEVVILDADDAASAASLSHAGGISKPSPRANGGAHIFFSLPEGTKLTNTVELDLGNGIKADVRGHGAMVLVWPSIHPETGKQYEPMEWPDQFPLIPDYLLEKLAAPADTVSGSCSANGPIDDDTSGPPIAKGSRDRSLYRIACKWRGLGHSHDEILASLLDLNAKQCAPPLESWEVRKIAKSACKYPPGPRAVSPAEQRPAATAGSATDPSDDWESLIPIDEAEVQPFPVDALPDWARDWVKALTVALQVPADLPGVMLLATLAAACAKRAHVVVRPGYSEPLNLYTVVALPPASRKSPVFRAAATPLDNVERNAAIGKRDLVAAADSQLEGLRERARKAIRAVGSASPEEVARCQADADALAIEVAEAERRAPVIPRMLTDDVTPEKLALLLEQHDGVMAVLSPEGGEVFEVARGRYSSNGRANLSVFLNGHSGDTIRVDRMGRESSIVAVPALTLGLTVQNDVIRDLNAPGFRGRGLLGRFLYSIPPTSIGKRDSRSDPVPDRIVSSYDRKVEALAGCPLDNIGMPLTSEAQELWFQFSEWIEPRLGEYGELGQISDWGGKLAGTVARIAGLLQVAERVDESDPFVGPVGDHAIRCAIELGHYFISHARSAFDLMGSDPDVELSKRVLRWIRSEGRQTVSKRDAWQRLKGGSVKEASDLDEPLRILVCHGYLRRVTPVEGPGRKPEIYEINPASHQ